MKQSAVLNMSDHFFRQPPNLYALVFLPPAIPINFGATGSLETSEFAADQTHCRFIRSATTLGAFSFTVMLN